MSRWRRGGQQLVPVLSCLALVSNAACTSTSVVKLRGSTRIVASAPTSAPAEVEFSPECAALIDHAHEALPVVWPSFDDAPATMTCDALGRALEPELAARMSRLIDRARDEYLLAGCRGAEPGNRGPLTVTLESNYGISLTERWSSRAPGEPAIDQQSGQFLYVAAHDTLQALDLSRSRAPRVVGHASLDGSRPQLLLHGHRLLAITRPRAEPRPTHCEPGTACEFAIERGTLLSLFELQDRAHPRLLEQLALSGDFAYAVLVGSVAHLVTDDTASNRLGLRFDPKPPAAGAPAIRRAMAELHAANSLAIARAEPAARLPGVSRRTANGTFTPFEPACSAYTVTHGSELQSILSFDLETSSLARTLLEAPFGTAQLISGELALDPPRPANPDGAPPPNGYRFALSHAPAKFARSAPLPPRRPAVWGGHAEIPLDPHHTLDVRSEFTNLTIGDAYAVDSLVRIRVLGDEPGAALRGTAPPVPEARVVPPSDPFGWSAQSYSFGYFPAPRLLSIASDPLEATTDITKQSPSVLSVFAVSSRAVTPLTVIRHYPFALPRTDEPRPEAVFIERGMLYDVTEEAVYVWDPSRPTLAPTRIAFAATP
ncbi:MAG TPA: beta-propeller domain-containing protein [Polyangiaceae bacterium]|nr:beta-propeller domain-containing protein [Polyangiaceae bacterium]